MIERHIQLPDYFTNESVAEYEEMWSKRLEAFQQRPANSLGFGFRAAHNFFALTVTGGLPRERILWALHAMNGIGVANFAFATHPGEAITVQLPDVSFVVTGQAITAYTDIETWLDAYCATVIARDRAGLLTLCAVPEEVHTQADVKPDTFGLAFVRAIKGLYDPNVPIGTLLIRAMEASHPDFFSGKRLAYVNHILYPQLPLYRCILSDEQAEFNEKVAQAVQEHKTFWGNDPYDPKGWVALPLLAACATALDHKGWEVPIETEYLPAWLTRVGMEV